MKRFSALFLIFLFGCAGTGEVRLVKGSSQMPNFVTSVPQGYIVGYSSQSKTVEEGKNLAIVDVMKQISGAIGSELWVDYQSRVEARNQHVEKHISDNTRIFSSALLKEIEPNIRQIYFEKYKKKVHKNTEYYYDTFILVHFPQPKIDMLRELVLRENQKRLAEFENLMTQAQNQDDFISSIHTYLGAKKISESLLKDRPFYERLAVQGLESLISSLRITKADAGRDSLIIQTTYQNGQGVRNLPLEIRLEKGSGYIPSHVFTDDRGQVVLDTKGITSEIPDNRISVKPRIASAKNLLENSSANIEFSTIGRSPKLEANTIKVDVLKLSGILIRKVDQVVLSVRLKEVNGIDIFLDRYHLKAVGYYPVFMKNTFDTVAREGDFFLQNPIHLKGSSKVIIIELDNWACKLLSDLLKDRKPSKLRVDVCFGNGEKQYCFFTTNDFTL